MSVLTIAEALLARREGHGPLAATSADPDPGVQARRDAEAITAHLTAQQRGHAAQVSGWGDGDPTSFTDHLASSRESVLRGHTPVPSSDREQAPPTARLTRGSAVSPAARLLGWAALGGFVLLCAVSLLTDPGRHVAGVPTAVAMALLAVILVACALTGFFAARARDDELIAWAVERPGQLARGIPAALGIRHRDAASELSTLLLRLVLLAAAFLLLVLGPVITLIRLSTGDGAVPVAGGPLMILLGAVLGLPALLWNRRARASGQTDARLRLALQWVATLPTAGPPDDEGSPQR